MALTKAEQERLVKLREVKQLRELQAARERGKSQYDNSLMVNKLAYGVAKPFQQLAYGIKDLWNDGDLSHEDKLFLEEIGGRNGYIGASGEIMGELAIPTAKVAGFLGKIAKEAPWLFKKSAKYLSDAGITIGLEGLKAPTEDKSRTDKMTETAVGYAATALGLKGLGAARNSLLPSESGKRLLDEGIPLTPAQASDNSIISGIEETLGSLPIASKSVQDMQNRSLGIYNNKIINEANPMRENQSIVGAGSDAFTQIQKNFDTSYKDAYGKIDKDNVDFSSLSRLMDSAKKQASGGVGSNAVNPTIRAISDAKKEIRRFQKEKGTSSDAIRNADDILRNFTSDDPSATQLVKQLRDKFKEGMGESGQRLRDIDTDYAKYAILRDSATSTKDPLQNDLIIAPANLTAGMKKSATPDMLLRNEGFYQQSAQDATNTFGKTRPGGNLLRRALAGSGVGGAAVIDPVSTGLGLTAGNLLASEPARKGIIGAMTRLDKQKATAELLRSSNLPKNLNTQEINPLLMKGVNEMTPQQLNELLNIGGGTEKLLRRYGGLMATSDDGDQ